MKSQQIFETKLEDIEKPKGQRLSKNEIEKKAKELAQERRNAEKLEAGNPEDLQETIPTNYSRNLPTIHITQGVSNIYHDIEKLIENATGIVYIVTTLEDLSKMYDANIPEKIKICEKNGGQIRLLTEVSSDEFLPIVNKFGATEARLGKINSKGRMIVEEEKRVIMSDVVCQDSDKQNTQYDYAISTDSSEIVNNIFMLCSFLWEKFNISKNSENSQARYDTIPITF